MKKIFTMFVMFLVLLFSTNIFAQVSFSVKTDFTLGAGTNSLIHADINGDGKQDIIATRTSPSQRVTVLLNTTAIGAATPTFSAATDFTIGGGNNSTIAVADFNGDGKLDIVASASWTSIVSVLLNTTPDGASTPSFSSYTSFTAGADAWSVETGDVNGDGKPDIVTANLSANSVSVLLNTTSNGASTPTFSSKTDFTVGLSPISVSIGDVNGDGKPDIVTANQGASTVSVLLNTTSNGASTPTFTSKTDFAAGATTYSVIIGDVNGDGKPDIVTANRSANTVSVLLNTTANGAATPTFSAKTDFAVGTSPSWVTIADFDGDGKSDIATANQGASTVSVLLNTTTVGASTPTFSSKSDFGVGTSPGSVTNADINGDNKPDIITSSNPASTASVLLSTTSFPSAIIWDGSASANWNTGDNWSTNMVPTASDNVTIPDVATNDPIISSAPAVCNNLTISWGGSLTISAGNALTVSGTLTNSAGASGLVINSGGSLIQSTAGVLATVERDISAWTDNNHGWHFLSSPVATQAIAPNFTNVTPANYDFYAWWEATNQWVNYKNTETAPTWNTANVLGATSGFGNFIPGKGYLVAYQSQSTKQFTGTLNKDNISVSNLTYNALANSGWHLLGNPFTSALTWGTGWSLTNINATAKIWNESGAGYTDILTGGIIPALNGFMVEVTASFGGNNSLTIPTNARLHDAAAWYKSSEFPTIKLTANDLSGQTAQESVIRFIPEATIGFDPSFDSHFLAGYAPQFYSVTGNVHLSTNALPEVGGIVQIPFHFIKNDGTSFTIEATSISNVQEPVILKDLKTNASQDLTQNPLYSFTSSSGDDPYRFNITFRPLGIGDPLKDNSFTVYASGNSIVVLDNTGTHLGNVIVYNMIGQIITQQKLSGSITTKISLNSSNEYYIVKVVSNDYTFSTKVFLH